MEYSCKISVTDKCRLYKSLIIILFYEYFFFFFVYEFDAWRSASLASKFLRKKETEDIQSSLMVPLMLGTCSSQISRQPSNFRERDIQEDRLVSLITWTWSPCVMNSIDQRGSQVLYADIEFPRVFSVFCDYLDKVQGCCKRNMFLYLKY